MGYPARPAIDRFWRFVDASDVGGCWLWVGGRQARGRYGAFSLDGGKHQIAAHRFAFETANGPIPVGHQIDHLCRNTLCVRPDHLEAVTAAENGRRSTRSLHETSKTHCPQGHPYDEENTRYAPKGSRICRTCVNARAKARYARDPTPWLEAAKRQRARNKAKRAVRL